ncbi:Uncharacterised protein [Mycobacteroides abscessus subsp. abscessus]|nr:Uncharacterised protein [Mycobacteroides abscessus subsp. abscessus]
MLVAERGATGRDRGRHTGQVHGHYVGVALDDHRLVPFGDVTLGQIEAEQHVRLLVQHRFRCVDVLGIHLVVVEQPAGAEADHLTRRTADGPQQPTVEPVHRATTTLPGQPGGLQLLEGESLAQQVFCQGVPARRRESTAEPLGRVGVEVPVHQVLPGGSGLGRLQRLGVELLRGGVRGEQPAAAALVPLHIGGRRPLVADGVVQPVGEQFDGFDEGDVLDLLHERVDVAALGAAEAVEQPMVGPHMERRRLLVVERAQALERVGTRAPQLHVLADDVLDAGAFTNGRDIAIRNPAGHAPSVGGA